MQLRFLQRRNSGWVIAIKDVCVSKYKIRHHAGIVTCMTRSVRLHAGVRCLRPIIEKLFRHRLQRSGRHEGARHTMTAE